ncbi:MAG: peroxide stress protein YaaA [Bacteroidota bacterium]
MILLISPSKTQDFAAPHSVELATQPKFTHDADRLVKVLQKKSVKKLESLMDLSENLAGMNFDRFQNYAYQSEGETANVQRQAILAYTGDVYSGFALDEYAEEDYNFAQKHLRIVSGLYGLLRPLDLIQPYRLEMKTPLKNTRGKDLYGFWKNRIVDTLNEALEESGSEILINLASNEYTRAIPKNRLNAEVITPTFKDFKNGEYKALMLFLKQARGKMADFAVREKLTTPDELKAFEGMGYQFNASLTEGNDWVFTRELA